MVVANAQGIVEENLTKEQRVLNHSKFTPTGMCHYLVIISYELSSKNFPKVKLNILGDKYGKKHDYERKI